MDIFSVIIQHALIVIILILRHAKGVEQEVCQFEQFLASCPDDHVILMTGAQYGRMRHGRCINRDYGYIGCSADVLTFAHARCSGKQKCSINIPDKQFEDANQCAEDLKYYLLANYTCVPVTHSERPCSNGDRIPVDSASGTLSSAMVSTTRCGGPASPWVIQADPEQIIRIRMTDYGAATGVGWSGQTSGHERVNAIVRDVRRPEATATLYMHEGRAGQGINSSKVVFERKGGEYEIRLMFRNISEPQFLLLYEVLGCRDVHPPGGQFRRVSLTHAQIKCPADVRYRNVTCVENKWTGNDVKCTGADGAVIVGDSSVSAAASLDEDSQFLHMPYELGIALIVSIAMVVGIFILAMGAFILSRKYCDRPAPTVQHYMVPSHKSYAVPPDALGRLDHDYAYVEDMQAVLQATPKPPPPPMTSRPLPPLTQKRPTPVHPPVIHPPDVNFRSRPGGYMCVSLEAVDRLDSRSNPRVADDLFDDARYS